MPQQQQALFTAEPFDVANIFWQRNVDESRLSPPVGGWQPGWVDGLFRAEMNVDATHTHQWLSTEIVNNRAAEGEQVVNYLQLRNSGAWAAGMVVQVIETPAQGFPGGLPVGAAPTTVGMEMDAQGNVERGIDMISLEGTLNTAVSIAPGHGGHIDVGLEISATTTMVDHNPDPHFIYLNPEQNAGLALIGGHFVAVEQGHAFLLAGAHA